MKIKGGARERDGQRRAGQAQAASVAKPYSKRVRPWTRRRKKAPRHERTHAQTRSRTARKTSHRLPLERAEPLLTFQGRRRPTNQSRAVEKKKKKSRERQRGRLKKGEGRKCTGVVAGPSNGESRRQFEASSTCRERRGPREPKRSTTRLRSPEREARANHEETCRGMFGASAPRRPCPAASVDASRMRDRDPLVPHERCMYVQMHVTA